MASEPAQVLTNITRTRTKLSEPLGGINLLRSQLAQTRPLSSDHPLPTSTTTIAGDANEMSPSNVHARPAPRPGSIRNPNAPWDFLPNTQNVLRGGFPPLVKDAPPKDPDKIYLAPHFPPKSNNFYELTSDGRLSDLYFENARLRRFRANPDLSIISAGLSPIPVKQNEEATPASPTPAPKDRIYIGQGNWRQANEKLSPLQENRKLYRHKYAQTPTHAGTRPWQPTSLQTFLTNEELWEAHGRTLGASDEQNGEQQFAEVDIDFVAAYLDDTGVIEREKFQLLSASIHRSSEREKDEEQDQTHLTTREPLVEEENRIFETTPSLHDVSSGSRAPPYAVHTPEGSRNQIPCNNQNTQRETGTEEFPPFVTYHTNMPGDRSGDNSRLGRTRMDLESSFFPKLSDEISEAENDISLNPVHMPDFD